MMYKCVNCGELLMIEDLHWHECGEGWLEMSSGRDVVWIWKPWKWLWQTYTSPSGRVVFKWRGPVRFDSWEL